MVARSLDEEAGLSSVCRQQEAATLAAASHPSFVAKHTSLDGSLDQRSLKPS